MFQDILDKIINDAEKMLVDINKNNLDMDDILLNDLYDFSNITFDKIDLITQNHIENMKIFLNYHSLISIFDVNDTSFEQLNDILNDNNLQLFKIKKLMKKDIQEYLIKSEKEIINEINSTLSDLNMIDKIQFYYEIYKNDAVKEYFEMIQNKNELTVLTVSNEYEKIDKIKIEEIFDSLIHKLNENIDFRKIEIYNMSWDNSIFLYKFFNKKTYKYVYIYFDLFKREDKSDIKNIIKLKSNIYCINEHFTSLNDNNIKKIEDYINKIILQLLE
jgi:hypothetical protein